ncbi:hypothetical protein BWZ20_05680 [Winogradskyella sp. J14-2]|uniref:MliC family protein n=1 Tax=Winogradskyella sp. J14-2 TaxID=1936080 RepID=UPI000972E921|nr:MliC family protein [Winogradskyella sp. J14-2]APY07816.1 hypothetical protein BWZ20_05680 [Winogradskyella sp. J14-2]
MKSILLKITAVILITASFSCKESSETQKDANATTETVTTNETVKKTYKDANGNTMHLEFNNEEGMVTVTFDSETFQLKDQRPASGMWYKNDTYELRGKGETFELSKNGSVVFSN